RRRCWPVARLGLRRFPPRFSDPAVPGLRRRGAACGRGASRPAGPRRHYGQRGARGSRRPQDPAEGGGRLPGQAGLRPDSGRGGEDTRRLQADGADGAERRGGERRAALGHGGPGQDRRAAAAGDDDQPESRDGQDGPAQPGADHHAGDGQGPQREPSDAAGPGSDPAGGDCRRRVRRRSTGATSEPRREPADAQHSLQLPPGRRAGAGRAARRLRRRAGRRRARHHHCRPEGLCRGRRGQHGRRDLGAASGRDADHPGRAGRRLVVRARAELAHQLLPGRLPDGRLRAAGSAHPLPGAASRRNLGEGTALVRRRRDLRRAAGRPRGRPGRWAGQLHASQRLRGRRRRRDLRRRRRRAARLRLAFRRGRALPGLGGEGQRRRGRRRFPDHRGRRRRRRRRHRRPAQRSVAAAQQRGDRGGRRRGARRQDRLHGARLQHRRLADARQRSRHGLGRPRRFAGGERRALQGLLPGLAGHAAPVRGPQGDDHAQLRRPGLLLLPAGGQRQPGGGGRTPGRDLSEALAQHHRPQPDRPEGQRRQALRGAARRAGEARLQRRRQVRDRSGELQRPLHPPVRRGRRIPGDGHGDAEQPAHTQHQAHRRGRRAGSHPGGALQPERVHRPVERDPDRAQRRGGGPRRHRAAPLDRGALQLLRGLRVAQRRLVAAGRPDLAARAEERRLLEKRLLQRSRGDRGYPDPVDRAADQPAVVGAARRDRGEPHPGLRHRAGQGQLSHS
ncbi:unnamed protein product, partial [Symbiodinium necroappetens]